MSQQSHVREQAESIGWGGVSDVGRQRRDNQDAFAADAAAGLFIVADGMGGGPAGEVAARVVVGVLPQSIGRMLARSAQRRARSVRYELRRAVMVLSRELRARTSADPVLHGTGATVVLALFRSGRVHIANMGDSRAYLLRGGHMAQLTLDHSVVGILLRRGEITPEQAGTHPARGRLSRYVGMQAEVYPDVRTLPLERADRVLLCSDGLNGMIPDGEIEAILNSEADPQAASERLVGAANQAGGKDNVTAVVVDWLRDGAAAGA